MKQTRHFDLDLPLSKQVPQGGRIATVCTGTLNIDGVAYLQGGEYDYDIEEIRFILPENHPDHVRAGKKIDLEMMEAVCGWEAKEEDYIHNGIMDHLIGLFAEPVVFEREDDDSLLDLAHQLTKFKRA